MRIWMDPKRMALSFLSSSLDQTLIVVTVRLQIRMAAKPVNIHKMFFFIVYCFIMWVNQLGYFQMFFGPIRVNSVSHLAISFTPRASILRSIVVATLKSAVPEQVNLLSSSA